MEDIFNDKMDETSIKEVLKKLNIEQLEYLMIEQLKKNLDLKEKLKELEGEI